MTTTRLAVFALAGIISCQAQSIELQARNVNMRLEHDVLLEIGALRGKLERAEPTTPVTFDNLNSFSIEVETGTIAISSANMAKLLNSDVFAYPQSPLKNIRVTYDSARNRIDLKGTMRKGVELPFEIEGALSATSDGNLGLHVDKIKSAHLPVKGLMHLFGEDLAKMINVSEARGIRIDGDDIVLYPGRMIPAPHFKGRMTRAFLKGDRLVQVFDSRTKPAPLDPPLKARAYIYHRGGALRFGKFTMDDADLELVRDPAAAVFEFCPRDYKRQLLAGYWKYTPEGGLVAHIPDYSQVRITSPVLATAPRDVAHPGGR